MYFEEYVQRNTKEFTDKAEKYSSEYEVFQAWREHAKTVAKSVIQ